MGKGRSRRRKQRKQRKSKQDALCLPPAQDTATLEAKMSSATASAIPLNSDEEALVIGAVDADASAPALKLSRQARRKAARQQAKAKKRKGVLVAAEAEVEEAQMVAPEETAETVLPVTRIEPVSEPIEQPQGLGDPLPTAATLVDDGPPTPIIGVIPQPTILSEDYLIVAEDIDADETTKELKEEASSPANHFGAFELEAAHQEPSIAYAFELKPSEPALALSERTHPADPALTDLDEPPPFEVDTPLPRNRSLTDPNATMLQKMRRWIAGMFATKQRLNPNEDHVSQLRLLKADLASVQRRIDRMLGLPNG